METENEDGTVDSQKFLHLMFSVFKENVTSTGRSDTMDWLDTTKCMGNEDNDCEDINDANDPNSCGKLYINKCNDII